MLAVGAIIAQALLREQRQVKTSAATESALAALGGLRSLGAEIIWFRADRLQEEGRYVELSQLANALAYMEPHTPEVWSYAAWNLAYNVSIMMPKPEDRWHWVDAAIRMLRDRGLKLNPGSKALLRELAWLFELKLGANLDIASPVYRQMWRKIVEDVRQRGAWEELGMDVRKMVEVEQATGFDDWTDPQLSAIYWAVQGGHEDIFRQASAIYRRRHPQVQKQFDIIHPNE